MRDIIWIGAPVTISNQPQGMPKQGEVSAINGAEITIRHWLTKAQEEEGLISTHGLYDRNLLSIHTPSAIEVARQGDTPLIIEEPHVELSSLVTISPYTRWGNPAEKPTLAIVNASAEFGHGTAQDMIRAYHSYARDGEGSRSSVFVGWMEMVKFEQATEGSVEWVGMLMKAQFFDPNKDTPWKHAKQSDVYEENYGYPYLGPQVRMKGLQTPSPVRVMLHTGTPRDLERILHWMLDLEDHQD
jgi:hypothetical protein